MLSLTRSRTGVVLAAALTVVASLGGNVSTAHAQQSGAGLRMSPCQDSLYQELKGRPLDQLSEREYDYLARRDRVCTRYRIARVSAGESADGRWQRSICNADRYRRVLETPADSMEVTRLRYVVRYVQNCQEQADRETTEQETPDRRPPDTSPATAERNHEPDPPRERLRQEPAEKKPETRRGGDEPEPTTGRAAADSTEPEATRQVESGLDAVRPSGGDVEFGSTFAGAAGTGIVAPSLRIGTSDDSYLEFVATILSHGTPNLGTGVRGGVDVLDGPALLEIGGSAARFWPGREETSWTVVTGFVTSGWEWTPTEDISILPSTWLIYRYPVSLTVAGEEVPLDQFAAYNGESRGSLSIVFGGKIKLWDTLSLGLTDTSQAVPGWYVGLEL